MIGIDPKTLRLHYRDELDLASAKANAVVGGALFNKAKAGDTTAMIFWMKTRAGWKETHGVEHTGKDGGQIVFNTVYEPKPKEPWSIPIKSAGISRRSTAPWSSAPTTA